MSILTKTLFLFTLLNLSLFANQHKIGFKDSKPFNKNSLLTKDTQSSFSLMDPARFSMQQSYSTSMSYAGSGSYSYGLYLNRLSYQLSNPLSLSMDLGFYTPFSASGVYQNNLDQSQGMGSFVIPKVRLDYKPNDKMSFSLQFINLKAPGQQRQNSFLSP